MFDNSHQERRYEIARELYLNGEISEELLEDVIDAIINNRPPYTKEFIFDTMPDSHFDQFLTDVYSFTFLGRPIEYDHESGLYKSADQ